MDQVAQVREKTDLVSLISEHLTLKKTGRNFKALCPFHNEKTPSFIVSPERQIWHCFGCGKGGDAFTFLMEYENMEFPEALRTLAKKTGVELRNFSFRGASEKEKIYNLNKLSSKFYHFLLTKHSVGKKALSYLEKRGLGKGLLETFQIGFSPNLSSSLSDFLTKKKKEEKKELLKAGLSIERKEGLIDFFKGRVMFPLTDHRGNVVGFSARALSDSDQPKYLNTRETLVYQKGNLFFGLDKALEEIKKKNQAIVVEGEFDLISLFAQGIKNVVAIKGTALTDSQAGFLARFTKKVTLCLDKDEAGYGATKRSLEVLEKNNLTTTIVPYSGKDPDEAIKKNKVIFKKALKNDLPIYDFLLSKTLSENDKKEAKGLKKIIEELLPFFSQISNEVIKEHYLKKLSREIDTSYESLLREIQKLQKKEEKKDGEFSKDKRGRREILEGYLVSLIIQYDHPDKVLERVSKFIDSYVFELASIKKILNTLQSHFKSKKSFNTKAFLKSLPPELIRTFDKAFLFPIPSFSNIERYFLEVERVTNELMTFHIKDKLSLLAQKIKEKEKQKEEKELKVLEKQFSELISLLPKP